MQNLILSLTPRQLPEPTRPPSPDHRVPSGAPTTNMRGPTPDVTRHYTHRDSTRKTNLDPTFETGIRTPGWDDSP